MVIEAPGILLQPLFFITFLPKKIYILCFQNVNFPPASNLLPLIPLSYLPPYPHIKQISFSLVWLLFFSLVALLNTIEKYNIKMTKNAGSSNLGQDHSARSPWTGCSQFLPTTQKIIQFSDGKAPKPTDRIVSIYFREKKNTPIFKATILKWLVI